VRSAACTAAAVVLLLLQEFQSGIHSRIVLLGVPVVEDVFGLLCQSLKHAMSVNIPVPSTAAAAAAAAARWCCQV
jgi:hypothetical protein